MDDLDYIKEKVRIVDLCVNAGVSLIKRGSNYVGVCPFHNEKTPSFTVHPTENFYKCFGCGAGGDVIKFYRDFYKLDYAIAIKELNGLAGVDASFVPPKAESQISQNKFGMNVDINKIKKCMSSDELYVFDERLGMSLESEEVNEEINKAAFQAVQDFRLQRNKEIFFELYTYCLKYFGNDEAFLNYLVNDRKLSKLTIERSDLFFIGNYNQVGNHLKKVFPLADLQRSGLFNDDGNLIFFKHRIIIPYKWKNEIVYLRGRLWEGEGQKEADKSFSKYLGLKNDELNLNTPKRFYNVDAIEGLIPGEHLYITEGEFDALVMQDLGYNAIAIPGVGNIPGENWLKKLFPFKVFVLPDQDEAGKQLEVNLKIFFNSNSKTIYSKQLPAKDATELAKQF